MGWLDDPEVTDEGPWTGDPEVGQVEPSRKPGRRVNLSASTVTPDDGRMTPQKRADQFTDEALFYEENSRRMGVPEELIRPRANELYGLAAAQRRRARETDNQPETSWSEFPGEVSAEVGRQIENTIAGTKEMVGATRGSNARAEVRRQQVIPQMVAEQKERGGLYWEQPSVVAAAKELGMRPDQFVPADWEKYLQRTPEEAATYAGDQSGKSQRMTNLETEGRQRRERAAQVGQQYKPNLGGDFSAKNILFQAASSLPQTALGVGVGVVNPVAGAAVFGGTAFPQFYAEGKNKGLENEKAMSFAALMTASEALTELPLIEVVSQTPTGQAVMKRLAGQYAESLVGKTAGAAATEGVMEGLNQAIQIGIQDGTFNEQTSLGDALQQIAQAGLVGAVSGGTIGGLAAGGERLSRPKASAATAPAPNLTSERDFGQNPPSETSFGAAKGEGSFGYENDPVVPDEPQGVPTEATAPSPAQNASPEPAEAPVPSPAPAAPAQQSAVGPEFSAGGVTFRDHGDGSFTATNDETGGIVAAVETQDGNVTEETAAEGDFNAAVLNSLKEYMGARQAGVPRGTPAEAPKVTPHEVAGKTVEVNTQPTEKQTKAGNYKKGHVRIGGMDISIETPKGVKRSGVDEDGKKWSRKMEADYGYVRRSEGADGDAVDVFIGPNHQSDTAFIVDQLSKDGRKFDEHKVVIGANSKEEAVDLYMRHYPKGWRGMGAITPISVERFRQWAEKGVQKEPVAWAPPLERDAKKRQPEHDSVLEFIAKTKLHGSKGYGLSLAAMEREGLDPADMKALRGMGITRPFSKNGSESLDAMAETLAEHGYPVLDEDGNYSANKLLELISDEIAGNPVYSSRKQYRDPEEEKRSKLESFMQTYQSPENLFEVPDDELEHYIEMLQQLESAKGEPSDQVAFNRGKPPATMDLFGDPVAIKNELQRLMAEKDRRRNSGQVSVETGDPGDLFSQARQQTDLVDQAQAQPAKPEEKPEAKAPDVPVGQTPDLFGASKSETEEIAAEFDAAERSGSEDGELIHHLFDSPKKDEVVRLQDKVKVYNAKHGWMTVEEAKAKIAEWETHAVEQGKNSENGDKVVLSLFDLTGAWSLPWEQAGYDVWRFDIQNDAEAGDVTKFSAEFFNDWFGDFEGKDIYAILAACPCTDFASSGSRHFAAKDADGRTRSSVELVHRTLGVIEHFKPAVWAIENPVGRIESLTGLPPWRLSFDPNHLGDPYTKKTLLWGRFNGDLPIAPVEPTEGSKMHSKYGGKSQRTKNARSVTPEGFAYGFFMANNAKDNPVMAIANKYDRLDRDLIKQALDAGATEDEINSAVEDPYYQELNDEQANQALRDLIRTKGEKPALPKPAPKKKKAAPSSTTGLTDAGEKIGGARKDQWAVRGMTLADLEGMSESEAAILVNKAAVWKPNYQELIDAGMPVEVAAGVKALWDKLAAKPQNNTPVGRSDYIMAARVLRDLMTEVRTEEDLKALDGRFREAIGLGNWRDTTSAGYRQYWSLMKGRRTSLGFGWTEKQSARKLVAAGFPNAEPWTRLFKITGTGGRGVTDRGIQMYMELGDKLGTPVTREQILEGLYVVRAKGDNSEMGYATTKEAALELAKAIYEREKGAAKDKPPERPHLDSIKRTGKQVRTRDATPEDFLTDFGFRGIEFGNWAANDERQKLVNLAYDALHDLAEVLGIPPGALSLDGRMGLALGARGGGFGVAHYEPGKLVINMTKINGAGSLAHEWGHALDHYMGELDRQDAYTTTARGASGWYTMPGNATNQNLRPAMATAFRDLMAAMFKRDRSKAMAVREAELELERLQGMLTQEENRLVLAKAAETPNGHFISRLSVWIAEFKPRVARAQRRLEEVRGKDENDTSFGKTETSYAMNAAALSGKSSGGKLGYWQRPTEMFARAFESFVFDRLRGRELTSDYLVHGVEGERHASHPKGNPYPAGEERVAINAAFDKLFATIQTRPGEKAIALFHTEKPLGAAEFGEQIKQELGLDEFRVREHRGDLRVEMLLVSREKRRQGLGSKAMEALADYADTRGMRIILQTGERDDVHGTTSSNRLKRFYKRFGFFQNTGRNKDFTIRDNMIRLPRKVDRQIVKVKEDRATYTGEASLKVEDRKKPVKQPPSMVPMDLFSVTNNPNMTKAVRRIADTRGKVGLVAVGEFSTGISKVESASDAAHILAPIRKNAQENFVSLALDKDGKPLAVIRTGIGVIDGASVEPWSLVGSLLSVPGVAQVYFSHQHPSGALDPSQADERITNKLTDMFNGTGVDVRGMLIFTGGKKEAMLLMGRSEGYWPIAITPAPRRRKTPVLERQYVKFHNRSLALPSLQSPSETKAYVRGLGLDRTGLILLDNRHSVIGFLDMTNAEMQKLRTEDPATGVGMVMANLHEANAVAVIVSGNFKSISNIGALFENAGVRMLDGLYRKNASGAHDDTGEVLSSFAEGGHSTNVTYAHRARSAEVVPGPMAMSAAQEFERQSSDVGRLWAFVQLNNFTTQKGQTAHLAGTVYVPSSSLAGLKETRGAGTRKLDKGNIDELAEAMRVNGYDFRTPILVTVDGKGEATIFDGNHRVSAAAAIGMRDVPTRVIYLNGGEQVDGPFSPESLGQVAMASNNFSPTNTKAFKTWFGDSKVVDSSGQPLVVFHGGPVGTIESFRIGKDGMYGQGIYTTDDTFGANAYAKRPLPTGTGPETPTVYPLYLSIKNPATGAEAASLATWRGEAAVREELIRRGYDGIIDRREGVFIAFHPEQVKSAIGNEGTFDPANPSILANASIDHFAERNLDRVGAVRSAVNRLVTKYKTRPPIMVVQNFSDLPKAVFERIGGFKAMQSGVNALIDFTPAGPTMYIVASRIRSDQHLAEVMAHEMTHYGLEEVLEPFEWDAISEGILRDQKARVRDIIKSESRTLDMDNPQHRALVVHEVLAYMNQKYQTGQKFEPVEEKTWDRLMRAIRAFFAKLGLVGPAYTDQYISEWLDTLTARMRSPRVQAGKGDIPGFVNMDPLANKTPPPFYSAVARAVRESKTTKATGKQWFATLRNQQAIKPDELAWLDLENWLDKQEGPVTKEALQQYIAAHEIVVEDVNKSQPAGMRRIDEIVVQLSALGYEIDRDMDGTMIGLRSVTDDWNYPYDSDEETFLDDEGQSPPNNVVALGLEFGESYDAENDDTGAGARYGQYTLPGGSNYRVMLLKLPDAPQTMGDTPAEQFRNAEARTFRANHWSEQNVLAFFRTTDRIDEDGKSVLFVEEIQSDWHQKGRLRGYDTPKSPEDEWRIYELKGDIRKLKNQGTTEAQRAKYFTPGEYVTAFGSTKDMVVAYHPEKDGKRWSVDVREVRRNGTLGEIRNHATDPADDLIKEMENEILRLDPPGRVPDAPFKTSWPELVFKRVLRMAAEGGYDRVAWTTGAQQNDRYNLSNHIRALNHWYDAMSETYHLSYVPYELSDQDRRNFQPLGNYTAEELPDVVGAELAKKILAGEGVNEQPSLSTDKTLRGLDLEVGGEGMKGFYDTMMPSIVNRLVKKWGGRVSKTKIETGIVRMGGGTVGKPIGFKITDQHSLDINDAMRQSVLQGLPLFHRETQQRVQTGILEGEMSLEEGGTASRIWNWLVFRAQDKFNDVLRLQTEAKKYREDMAIPEAMDAYMRETLYHGRTEYGIEQYDKTYVQPLLKMVKTSGYTYDQVEQYLYARHAPEANAHIKKITTGNDMFEDDQEWHSGMTDEQAAAKMLELKASGDFSKLVAIGEHIDAMTKFRRDMLVAEGLKTPLEVGAWEAAYKHYVPLQGWADKPEKGRMPKRGKGYDTGGRIGKRRTGRKTLAGNVLATLVAQAQATIIMAEKAKVGRAFLEFAKTHPAPDFYTVNEVEMERYFHEPSGVVRERPVFRGLQRDNLLQVKVDGKDQWIEFNADNEQAMRIASAFKNLSSKEINSLLSFLLGVNRFLATINTSLNPEFVVSNLFRDLQTALINLNATEAKDLKVKILKDWKSAFAGIMSGEFGKGKSEWAQHFEDFKRLGAKTGWIDFASSPADLEETLRAGLKDTKPYDIVKWGIKPALKVVDKMNLAVENAIRLTVFVNARENGLSDDKAAELAKNLTINFNRKGDWGTEMNALFLFYNAASQGAAVLWNVMKNKQARRVLYGLAGMAMGLSILNRIIAGDDDDGENAYDKIPEYERASNLIIMLPRAWWYTLPSGEVANRIKIPLPYGYNMVYYTGTMAGDVIDHNFIGNKHSLDVGGMAASYLSEFIAAWNPLGSTSSLAQTVSPTIGDPFLALYENKNWYGGQIHPEAHQFDVPDPASQMYYRDASDLSKLMAHTLSRMSGGSEVTPGMFEVYPDSIDYMYEQVTGGLGRFAKNMGSTAVDLTIDREKLDVTDMPFVRRVVGASGNRYLTDTYYEHMDSVRYLEKERDAMQQIPRGTSDRLKKEQYIAANYATADRLYTQAKSADGKISRLRKEKRALQEHAGSMQESKREERLKAIEKDIQEVMDEFNTQWNEVENATRSSSDTRGVIGKISPLIEGKTKPEAVSSVRKAGMPALASLMDAMPFRPRQGMADVYRKELVS